MSSSLYEYLNPSNSGSTQRDSMSSHLFAYLNEGEENNHSLIKYLQSQQQQNNDILNNCNILKHFDEYERTEGVKISEYVSTFDQKYQTLHRKGITLSPAALALKILSKARLNKQEEVLVKKSMDFSRTDGIFEEAKEALMKLSEYEDLRRGFRELERCVSSQECVPGRFYLILDSACSSTLCGRKWLDAYLDSLGEELIGEVEYNNSEKMFVFGGGAPVSSLATCRIPAYLAGAMVTITVDVVPNDLPLIFSLGDMKKAQVKLDFTSDTAEIFGQLINLKITESGHYSVPIDGVSAKRRKRLRQLSEEIRILEELVTGK